MANTALRGGLNRPALKPLSIFRQLAGSALCPCGSNLAGQCERCVNAGTPDNLQYRAYADAFDQGFDDARR